MSTEDGANHCSNKKLSSHFQYQQLKVGETKYLIGARRINDSRQILLTDLTEFFEETISKKDGMNRVEELNPLPPDCDIDEILDDLLLNIPKYTTSCSKECIELENLIEDGRFWFRINLTKADPKPFLHQNTENVYSSLSELYHRYNCLLDLVKKKDREIDEYKAQGVKIVKKSLVTDPFHEELFETKLKEVEPMTKMDIFLKTMCFFNSISKSDSRMNPEKLNASPLEKEITVGISDAPSVNKKIAVKRPASSDIRCAVISKNGKKVKQSQKKSILKYI